MRTNHQTGSVSLAGLFQSVISKLFHLTHLVQQHGKISDEVQQISDLLETLPLTSDEFGMACNRLRSAQRYLQASERGAQTGNSTCFGRTFGDG